MRTVIFTLLLSLVVAPWVSAAPNDQFANATELGSSVSHSLRADTSYATAQVGEPDHSANLGEGTVWWKWTAPAHGVWEIAVRNDPFHFYVLAVYTGTALDQLALVEKALDDPLSVSVDEGNVYWLVLEMGAGVAEMDLSFRPSPANDYFANRISLGSATDLTAKGSTVDASREEGEPLHANDSSQGPSIWWEWVPPEDGVLRFDLVGSESVNWWVSLYTGSELNGLTPVKDRNARTNSTVTSVRVVGGQPLSIAAAQDQAGAASAICMNLEFEPFVFNDDPADAIDLGNVRTAEIRADLTGATDEDGGSGRTLWWEWDPDANGEARLELGASVISAGVELTVYRKLVDNSLEEVRTSTAWIDFQVREEDRFVFRMRHRSDREGPVEMTLRLVAAQENDDYADASPLAMGDNPFDLHESSVEPEEASNGHRWFGSLWWTWTAPADGLLALNFDPDGDRPELHVFEGSELEALVEVGRGLVLPSRTEVNAGSTYSIALADRTLGSASHPGLMRARFTPFSTGNDDFADAIDLGSAAHLRLAANSAGSTREADEPSLGPWGGSLWWKWTAPAKAYVRFGGQARSSSSWNSAGVGVFTGPDLANLVRMDNGASFSATAGATYYLGAYEGSISPVLFDLELTAYPDPPPNDAFAAPIDLGEVETWSERLSFFGATVEAGEPQGFTPGHVMQGTRWWTWTSPRDQVVVIESVDSRQHVVAIYQGDDPAALDLVVVRGASRKDVRFAARAGETYRILIDGGVFVLLDVRLRTMPHVPGDLFAEAVEVEVGANTILRDESAEGGSLERGEPAPLDPLDDRSFWWHWRAPAHGLLESTLGSSSTVSSWRVFEGDSLDTLVEVDATVPLSIAKDQDYFFLLHWGRLPPHRAAATLNFRPLLPNDQFAAATELGGLVDYEEARINLATVTLEPGEEALVDPAGVATNPGSIWWRWTAPLTGALSLEAASNSSSEGRVLAVFTGDSLESLQLVGRRESLQFRNGVELSVPVREGREYSLLFANLDLRSNSEVSLTLTAGPNPPNDFWREAIDLGNDEVVSGAGSNVGATLEGFETNRAGTAWWKWTVPREGTAYFLARIEGQSEEVRVYRSDGVGGLEELPLVSAFVEPTSGVGAGWKAQAGATYYFSVSGRFAPGEGPILVSGLVIDPPANDLFADREVLPGEGEVMVSGTTVGALLEAGEPDPAAGSGSDASGTVWYSWTAPQDGLVVAEVDGINREMVAVYTGAIPGGLTEVAIGAAGVAGWIAQAGTTYQVAVVGTGGRTGTFTLRLHPEEPVTNDDFADRINLGNGLPLVVTGHNFGATRESGEPPNARTMWYEWTAAESGLIVLDAVASSAAVRFAVSTGSALGSLTAVVSGEPVVGFEATAGATYLIAVDDFRDRAGYFSFELKRGEVPRNDSFANRIVITDPSERLGGDLFFATNESGEPGFGQIQHTLWWEWTAPVSGRVVFHSRSERRPEIWTYSAFRTPVQISTLRSHSNSPSEISVQAGITYYFQVGTRRNETGGSFEIELELPGGSPSTSFGGPPNDDLADRLALPSKPTVRAAVDPLHATNEAGEPFSSRTRAVWWSWIAPAGGDYQIVPADSTSRILELAVYTGTSLQDLALVVEAPYRTSAWFAAEQGVEYIIMVRSDRYDTDFDGREDRVVGFDIRPALAAPSNDHFADRTSLGSDLGGLGEGRTAGASAEDGEPAHGGVAATRSAWYEWSAPGTGSYRITASGTGLRVAVYTGKVLSELTAVASGDSALEIVASEGTSYLWAVDSDTAADYSLTVREVVAPLPTPANDDFEQAVAVSGAHETIEAHNFGTGLQVGEPWHDRDETQSGSVWWAWTAPMDGPVTVSNDRLLTRIAIYLGDELARLTPLIAHNNSVRFMATAGATYRIAVSGGNPDSFGVFTLTIDQTIAGPPNDQFANPVVIPGLAVAVPGTTVGSSWQPGEPVHGRFDDVCPFSVWYAWTAPAADLYEVQYEVDGSACLSVYTGTSLENLQTIARNEGATLKWPAISGTTYYLAVSERFVPDDFAIRVHRLGFPPNDHFADRHELGAATTVMGSGTTFDATREAGEPVHDNAFRPGPSIWWSWIAPQDGVAAIDFSGSEETNVVAIYTGDALESLELVFEDTTNVVAFPVTAGTRYKLAVAASSDSLFRQGPVEFVLGLGGPGNDHFADRERLPSTLPISASGTNFGATVELGEPPHNTSSSLRHRTIWWEWTAPTTALVDFDASASGAGAIAAVYTGTTLPFLTPVESVSSDRQTLRFEAQARSTYLIALGTDSSQLMKELAFEIQPARPAPPNDHFADTIVLAGESGTSSSHSWAVTTEPGEPDSLEHSLWWSWIASRSGWVELSAENGEPVLFTGNDLTSLAEGERLTPGTRRYLVRSGMRYWIAVSTVPSRLVTVNVAMGPAGDLFEFPIELPGGGEVQVSGAIREAGWEPLEPFHAGAPALHSIWFRWTPPADRAYRLTARKAGREYRLALYKGDQLTALCPVAEGDGELVAELTGGEEYRLVIDSDSRSGVGEQFDLAIETDASPYRTWTERFFADPGAEAALPLGDADLDGRLNLFEMAFGTHPLLPDFGEIPFTVGEFEGLIVLSAVRPAGVDGIRYSFEVSRSLDGDWQWTGLLDRLQWTEAHEDGTETFRVLLTDLRFSEEPEFFARLRVELGDDPLD